jgi:hypothetical protein
MPYEAKKNGENWDVVNKETGAVKATHEPPDAEAQAKRQATLLNDVESNPEWGEN